MNHRTFRHCCISVAVLLFTFAVRPANAASVPISGSYEIVQKADLGSQTKILVRYHLTNRGQSSLSVQGVLLSDFAHPPNGGPLKPPVTLSPGASGDISQELVIPRLQFDQWQRGVRPRAILELQTAAGARATQAIRLGRVAARKGE
jgi:hypothetical protein